MRNGIVGGLSELLDVTDKLNVMVRELSLGERMKMELIAALLHSPRVLFLDEPTIGLDVTSQKKVREFLRALQLRATASSPCSRATTCRTSRSSASASSSSTTAAFSSTARLPTIIDRFATHKMVEPRLRRGAGAARFPRVRRDRRIDAPIPCSLKVPRAQGHGDLPRDPGPPATSRDISVQELPVEEVIRQVFGEAAEAEEETGLPGHADRERVISANRGRRPGLSSKTVW